MKFTDLNLPDFVGKGFLHGSRSKYRGWDFNLGYTETYADENSDWDFAVQHTEQTLEYFETNPDWTKMDVHSYQDANTTHVFDNGKGVQVGLRSDLQEFVTVWSLITPEFYEMFIWKRNPDFKGKESVRMILDTLFYAYREGTCRKGYNQ